jgi:hypothetical protein
MLVAAVLEANDSAEILSLVRDLGIAYFALLLGLRMIGFPMFQSFIELREDGVRYGKRQFVPWDKITRVESIKRLSRKPYLVFRTSHWRAAGLFGRVIQGSMLPLSAFDTRKSVNQWLEDLRDFAPELELPSNHA